MHRYFMFQRIERLIDRSAILYVALNVMLAGATLFVGV
jgi:hypothetical protein